MSRPPPQPSPLTQLHPLTDDMSSIATRLFDVETSVALLTLWLPASLQMATDWMRPLVFNIFTSSNIKSSSLTQEQAGLEEDAVGLSIMSLNLLLFATAYGFNGAVDSYTSIAFGAGDRPALFAVLRRQLVLLCALGVVAAGLLASVETVFLAIGVHADLAARAAQLLRLMAWAVPGDFAYDAVARWMRGQQLHRLVSACSLTALALSLLVNVLAMSPTSPTRGPLLALIAQNSVLPPLLIGAYCYGTSRSLAEVARACAGFDATGESAEVAGPTLVETGARGTCAWPSVPFCEQLRTAIAAMIWTCAELWAWEVQVFEAAHFGTGNAAAYTLLSSTYSLLINIFAVSVSSAASALIGEALGRRDTARAVRLLRTACTLALLFSAGYALPMSTQRHAVAAVLCGGVADVSTAYARALPLVLSMHLLDGLFNSLKQWLVLRRKQAFGALMSLVVYYGVGVPIGIYLAFGRGWGLLGLWAGLGVAVLLGTLATGTQVALDIASLSCRAPTAISTENAAAATDYVDAEELMRLQRSDAGASASLEGASPSIRAPLTRHLGWLCGLLLPGAIAFGALVVTPVEPLQRAPDEPRHNLTLLQGGAPCVWSTGGAFYDYPFTAVWDATSGAYGWEVRIADRSKASSGTEGGRRLQPRAVVATDRALGEPQQPQQPQLTGFGALRFGGDVDVYDRAYSVPINPEIEVGWAIYLAPPEVLPDPRAPGEWTSTAFVGTRVSNATHTFCGCQTMRGDGERFRLTEHARAQFQMAPSAPSDAPWYLNLTRRQINSQIRDTCKALQAQTRCPSNETAFAEYEGRRENGTYWVLPPWVELYASLPQA